MNSMVVALVYCADGHVCSVVLNSVTPRTAARQAPLSVGFPRQEYWSGLPFLTPRDLPNPGIEPMSPALAGECFTTELHGCTVHMSLIENPGWSSKMMWW